MVPHIWNDLEPLERLELKHLIGTCGACSTDWVFQTRSRSDTASPMPITRARGA